MKLNEMNQIDLPKMLNNVEYYKIMLIQTD